MTILAPSPIAFSREPNAQGEARSSSALSRPPVFAMRPTPADWLGSALLALERVSRLEENWDSYGGSSANTDSISFAAKMLEQFAKFQLIEQPVITLDPNGNVELSWDCESRSLDATIRTDGLIEYVFVDENRRDDQHEMTSDTGRLVLLLTQW